MSMSVGYIMKVLSLHGIRNYTKFGRVYANNVYTLDGELHDAEYIDVTDYSRNQLYSWLGY